MKKLIGLFGGGLIVCAIAMTARASPAVGVTPTLLARGTYRASRSNHIARLRLNSKPRPSPQWTYWCEHTTMPSADPQGGIRTRVRCSSPWSRAF